MADLIRMSGLVAAQLRQGPAAELGAAAGARPVAGQGAETPTAAAELQLGPARPGESALPAEGLRARQEEIARLDARVAALEALGRLLAAARAGGAAERTAFDQGAPELVGGSQLGAGLSELLANGAVNATPDIFRAAEIETAGALLLARGDAASGRAALSRDQVAAENATAQGVNVEQVERAAAPLRGQGQPEEMLALSDALRAAPMNRNRVLDLLAGGIR